MARAFSNSYLAGEPAARAFFAPNFRDPAARIARTRLAGKQALPPALLEVLAEQQARLPPSLARLSNLAALAAGGTAMVVTGQQVGLFLGPLYSFYKAASAIAVARALAAESGIRCVPLFWLQTEDHDFAEISSCVVADREGEPVRLALADEYHGVGRASVAYRVLGGQVVDLLDALARALGPEPPAQEVLALLRAHYLPGRTMAAAFASVLASVFADEGLLILDPRDARVAGLAAPIYRSCVENAEAIEVRLKERQVALAAAGFDEQVPVRDRGALVFFHRDSAAGPRFRIQRPLAQAGVPTWVLAGTSRVGSPPTLLAAHHRGRVWEPSEGSHDNVISHEHLMAALAHEPLRFSTSALLRPIVQDALLPTAAYVGGPGEINYFAQLGPLYQHFQVTPPLLVPRARFCCVDARTGRWLGQLGLKAADLSLPPDELRARLTTPRPAGCPDPMELRALVADQIFPAIEKITNAVAAAGAHLHRPAERTRDSVAHGLERLIGRYARTLVERDEVTSRRLHRVELALYPEGVPQERFYGWPSLAGRLGISVFKRLVLEKLQDTGPFVTEVQEMQT